MTDKLEEAREQVAESATRLAMDSDPVRRAFGRLMLSNVNLAMAEFFQAEAKTSPVELTGAVTLFAAHISAFPIKSLPPEMREIMMEAAKAQFADFLRKMVEAEFPSR